MKEAAVGNGELKRIAKTMSFLLGDDPILIVTAGDARVIIINTPAEANSFLMIPGELVEKYIGHAPGGVCPFAIPQGTKVFLDISLKRFAIVYPAAGTSNSAIELSIKELEDSSAYTAWIDVCKGWQEE